MMIGNRISIRLMTFILVFGSLLFNFSCQNRSNDIFELGSRYIAGWKHFYPSSAFAMGHKKSAFHFEELSGERVKNWVKFNRDILIEIENNKQSDFDNRVDRRLLRRKVETELMKWKNDQEYRMNPSLYSGMITQALTHILVRKNLTYREKIKAIRVRLAGIQKLCLFAEKNLKSGRPAQTSRCLRGLQTSVSFYENKLRELVRGWIGADRMKNFEKACQKTADSIKSLIFHLKGKVLPDMSKNTDAIGRPEYSQKLILYTGLSLSPEELEHLAREEILLVRKKMAEVASEYWTETYPGHQHPEDFQELISRIIGDMEADREKNQRNFLKLFVELTNQAETFVREKRLAELPERRTLYIDLSPAHFAGAAVGGVYSAGPFDPEADTLFYLPAVPDTFPEKVKEGFYRSFNNHFNAMIITHEMFPGHYLHLKIAARNPRQIRSLFGCSVYAEGWATLCEQVTLDAGWKNFNKLTRLAHLRKRLENAVRAYASVQVHCRGWGKEKLKNFAVHIGLLAPQFAVNLWHRVIGSPFQLTSYFLGFRAFKEVYEIESKKQGTSFSIYHFSNKILRAGSMPVDELPALFEQ
jgi:hypothetical protein